jgi:hypothetical protein
VNLGAVYRCFFVSFFPLFVSSPFSHYTSDFRPGATNNILTADLTLRTFTTGFLLEREDLV